PRPYISSNTSLINTITIQISFVSNLIHLVLPLIEYFQLPQNQPPPYYLTYPCIFLPYHFNIHKSIFESNEMLKRNAASVITADNKIITLSIVSYDMQRKVAPPLEKKHCNKETKHNNLKNND
ncbi:12154_t:CDS:1, partial [Gigaspora margarita]